MANQLQAIISTPAPINASTAWPRGAPRPHGALARPAPAPVLLVPERQLAQARPCGYTADQRPCRLGAVEPWSGHPLNSGERDPNRVPARATVERVLPNEWGA